jgi:short-subunit dehydrogenase
MSAWNGKTAIVTGGSSGLGLAIAAALVEAGANVTIAARDADKLQTAAKQLQSRGTGNVLPISADITQPSDVERMVAETLARFGRLDMLVNNAGSSARGDVLTTTTNDFRQLMELNFFALVSCTRAALEPLLASQGHVVNIGSLAAKCASRYMGAYAASKFPVAAYSQQLRLELAERGLHVLLVCPGPIASDVPRTYSGTDTLPEAARKPGAGVKVGRIQPDQLARQILRACERRRPELVVPGKARLLFAIAQLSPSLGDWLLRKFTS